jgi:L-aspartate oxidase
MTNSNPVDVLVIGAGLAGLGLSLRVAQTGLRVTLLAKGPLTEGSSLYAQGGIAAVIGERDSFEAHIQDTLTAGAGLCHPQAVDYIVRRGPQNVQWLIKQGVEFDRLENADGIHNFHLAQEGGHSHRRVIHARDATGRAVENTLESRVRTHPNVTILENHIAVDLISASKLKLDPPERVLGAYVFDMTNNRVSPISARVTVLATGGASKSYLYTSNPDTSTGDGIAMAWRVGCRVANMEFVQFHPTCLYHPHAKSLLVSEAVRGEGGRLLLPDGEQFMQQHDPRGELAPRDIVARAIDYEMKRHGYDSVYLDISHKPSSFIKEHFPNIYERCLDFGIDMTKQPVPVVPAAHYTCGGVLTDLRGRTDLLDLYTIGESGFTGLHGANRLASNSLLECLVLAESASKDIVKRVTDPTAEVVELPQWDESQVTDPDEQVVVSHNWEELRRSMWDYVGIVRTDKRLQRAQRRIALLQEEIRDFYSNFKINSDLIELRNLVMVSELIVKSALSRKESRGLHYTLDYPYSDKESHPQDTIVVPNNFVGAHLDPLWATEAQR